MEFIESIKEEDYENFVVNHPKSHFMQSYYWGEVMKLKHFTPYYVGMKENGELLATALVLKKHLVGKYSYFYIPRGFVTDYHNSSYIKIFTTYLKNFAKKHHVIFIKIDPDIKLHDLDIEGNILGDETDGGKVFNLLIDNGYRHLGFNKAFTNEQPRFTFRLDLNRPWEDIYSGMHPTTRKILNKGNLYELNLYKGDVNDIPLFYETMLETAKREGLHATSIEYYKHFYEVLHKNNMSDVYVVKTTKDHLIEFFQKRILDIENEVIHLEDRLKSVEKIKVRKKELEAQLVKQQQLYQEILNITNGEIILSSIMTVKYGNKVWTIHGGNSTVLRELNSNYLLYYQIIKDAYQDHYQIIDFFGCSGEANPDSKDPIFGLHSFKKRLGGEYTEFLGEFDLILNSLLYTLYKKGIPLYRKIKKRG